MKREEVIIKIGGEAGFGIKVSGLVLGRVLFNEGYGLFGYSEYPSFIRGGHSTYQLNISTKKVGSATENVDMLVALNKNTLEQDLKYVRKDGVVIVDGIDVAKKNVQVVDVPLMKLAEKTGGAFMRNMVAMGAVMNVLGLKLKLLEEEISATFAKKGKQIVEMNKKAAKSGYKHVDKNYKKLEKFEVKPNVRAKGDRLLTANEATAYGMVQAGCKFYSAYPMTPATSVMHVLAAKQRYFDIVVHQTEDEISAIGAAIGASVGGVRAATGTSGGGFTLMTENIGFAGIAEIPLVVIESQRTSPASGMPTWTEQGDMQYIIRASHGEFPRIVFTPGDAEEAFYLIGEAFNLAEKFQVPVIFLMDKMISESDFAIYKLDPKKIKIKREGLINDSELLRTKDYKRYEWVKNGLSKRAVPGQEGGVHVVNSDEHDEHGFSTEDSEVRIKSMDKRFKKMKLIEAELPEPKLYGPADVELTVVGWGSVKGVVVDAIEGFEKVNYLHLNYVWPFPTKRVKAVLGKAKKTLLVENNKTAQLGDLIKQEAGIEIKNKFLKYDGRPFFREEVIEEIKRYLK